ncbi:uncharacterized protein LOC110735978 [Chenopodium quinoa]|uniref:uncharacterized protein LOC110735978 n=1 Tax=Chenopodium quinoa TaxID=63459 RepID=UPI000B77A289|nr:uncharacterized protein LOC110735978 [Chenopodium quinoa]
MSINAVEEGNHEYQRDISGVRGGPLEPEVAVENVQMESPIQIDSDSDDQPVRMRKIVRFKGESSKRRGQCSNSHEVKNVGAEGGKTDIEISDDDAEVKQVIYSTVVVRVEEVQEQPAIGEGNDGLVRQEQQQPQIYQMRDLEEEPEHEEEEGEDQDDLLYDDSEEDIGYPYHYHSPEVSADDDDAYGFDSD